MLPYIVSPSIITSTSTSTAPQKNLSLPLNRHHQHGINSEITFSLAYPPQGGHLIYSLLKATISAWQDVTNQQLPLITSKRYSPFREISHIISTSTIPGNRLTLLDIGVVYCKILNRVPTEPFWPGKISAEIYRENTEEGTIGPWLGGVRIWNDRVPVPIREAKPLNAKDGELLQDLTDAANTTPNTSAAHTDRTSSLHLGEIREKVWLALVIDVMFWIFLHGFDAPLSISLTESTYRFESRLDSSMYLDLTITKAAFVPRRFRCEWITLADGMMDMLERTMRGGRWRAVMNWLIGFEGDIVARVSVGVRLVRGGSEETGM
ncbi:MAG: hypothetical protein Q9186_000132 [Xanthomendoza sp. 1 TL-2023]